MTIDELLKKESEWLKGIGPNSDIAISSRTRLARNISNIPFSHRADKQALSRALSIIRDAVLSIDSFKSATFFDLKEMSDVDRMILVERHLMSPEHAVNVEYKGLIIDPDEIVSIMINEEDHMRIQVIKSGFNIKESWNILNDIDTKISAKLPYAFSAKWGYLTACPTNTGTALRVSVMIHLPALVFAGQANNILQAIAKLGLNIRGFYGEGTETLGNIFQISNQASLGMAEEEIVDNIERIVNQTISTEDNARKSFLLKNRETLEDRVSRAYGTLMSARIISSDETVTLLSAIRLGVDLGMLKNIDRKMVNELFILTQPAHLQKLEGKMLNSDERDKKRADIIRERLK